MAMPRHHTYTDARCHWLHPRACPVPPPAPPLPQLPALELGPLTAQPLQLRVLDRRATPTDSAQCVQRVRAALCNPSQPLGRGDGGCCPDARLSGGSGRTVSEVGGAAAIVVRETCIAPSS
jgi:hypothetical protein